MFWMLRFRVEVGLEMENVVFEKQSTHPNNKAAKSNMKSVRCCALVQGTSFMPIVLVVYYRNIAMCIVSGFNDVSTH